MSNKNNNLIATFGSVLAMFVLILIPFKSFAYITQGAYTVYEGGGTNTSNYVSTGGTNSGYTTSGGSNINTPQIAKVTTTGAKVNENIAKVTTGGADATDGKTSKNSSLSANSLSSGFMPSSLLGWIFLLILIYLAVTLWRKVYVTDAEKNKPLKHA